MTAQSGRSRTALSFFTTELKEGFVVKATHRPFYPGNGPLTVLQETCWVTGPHWTAAEKLVLNQELIPRPSSL